jgi:hypothetical protein
MSRTTPSSLKFVKALHSEHRKYWSDKRELMKKFKNSYEVQFWKDLGPSARKLDEMVRIETADAHSYIESFISALFSKSPSVVIGADLAASKGEPKLAQAAANRFLYNSRSPIEQATRLALIYPFSGIKLCPQESNEMLDRVSPIAIPPWEVIVDRDAGSTESQRFVGHTYFMNLVEAKSKWGDKEWKAIPKEDYFAPQQKSPYPGATLNDLPDDFLYVEIVEIYDFVHKRVYFWTPQWKSGEQFLLDEDIPLTTYNGRPLSPIITLFYNRVPSQPLEGISALSKIWDQVYEKNIIRTYWANAVRRDTRQFIYKEGAIDEESLAKITAGIDGAMIPVDSDSLDGIIREVAVTPISTNFDRYLNMVEADLNRGSALAPFNRGEATRATATEITALAQYSASEIGKMARDRDGAIEELVNVYLRSLVLLGEEGETEVLDVEGEARVLTPQQLEGKFRIAALDQGATPLSDAIRKQNLLALLPTLQGLGVSGTKIREELIRAYELPPTFLQIDEVIPTPSASPSPSGGDIDKIEGGPMEQTTGAQELAQILQK